MNIVALFCDIDDFCRHFEPGMQAHLRPVRQRRRSSRMHLSEVMTILVLFHLQGCRPFKQFYLEHVCVHLRGEFPYLVNLGVPWARFVKLQGAALLSMSMTGALGNVIVRPCNCG